MKKSQTEKVFIISMAAIVIAFCLTTSLLTRRVNQVQTTAQIAMTNQEVSIESLKKLCLGMIELNGKDKNNIWRIDKGIPSKLFQSK